MSVQFTDYSVEVKAALEEAAIAYLYEAGGELEAQVKRNTRIGKENSGAHTKNKWSYRVDESELTVTVGNPLENAIWEEFGTGEYALNGDGRKGGWWIPVGNGGISKTQAEAYGWEKVKRNKDGEITFVFTRGKKPHRAFKRAFTSSKNFLKRRAKETIGAKMHE